MRVLSIRSYSEPESGGMLTLPPGAGGSPDRMNRIDRMGFWTLPRAVPTCRERCAPAGHALGWYE